MSLSDSLSSGVPPHFTLGSTLISLMSMGPIISGECATWSSAVNRNIPMILVSATYFLFSGFFLNFLCSGFSFIQSQIIILNKFIDMIIKKLGFIKQHFIIIYYDSSL